MYVVWSSCLTDSYSRHPKSAGSSATVPCRKTLNQPTGKSQGNHTKQYRRQQKRTNALILVINSYLQAVPQFHETMTLHERRTPLVQWQTPSLVQPMKWWKGGAIWLHHPHRAMTMLKQRGSASSGTKLTERKNIEEDYNSRLRKNAERRISHQERLLFGNKVLSLQTE